MGSAESDSCISVSMRIAAVSSIVACMCRMRMQMRTVIQSLGRVIVCGCAASRWTLGSKRQMVETQLKSGQSQRQHGSGGKFRRVSDRDDDLALRQFARAVPIAQRMADAERIGGCELCQPNDHDRFRWAGDNKQATAIVVEYRAIKQPSWLGEIHSDGRTVLSAKQHAPACRIRGGYRYPLDPASSELWRTHPAEDSRCNRWVKVLFNHWSYFRS